MSLQYKGYTGHAEYDDEAGIFHGEVLGIRDVVTFEGKSVKEIEKAFRDSVDVYLEWCAEEGTEPNKPFSGQFRLRLEAELHRKIAIAAKQAGESINSWVTRAIKRSLSV